MRRSRSVAVVAVFTALIVGSDFALTPYANLKLMDVTVFLVAFVFGLRSGTAVAVLSETVWSVVSPWGPAGVIAPFLVLGELLFAVAGWASWKVWGDERNLLSPTSLFIGSALAICAFVWDLETNAATALIQYWPSLTLGKLVATELAGFVFPTPLAHEIWDFVIGAFMAPAALLAVSRVRRR